MRIYRSLLNILVLLVLPVELANASSYVGGEHCGTCHQKEYQMWQGSHHDRAMQPANDKTVLGNFDNASLTHFGVTSTFFKKDGRFMVRTEGADGKLHDYEIKYTFGFDPLQQYLIEITGGRLQALSLAWDARSKGQGGQRWFHLFPDEKIAHDDVLHWTQPSQNWNSMCAECHSTHLVKNYDAATKSFSTQWSEVNVACEACHGPGLNHVSWANKKPGWEKQQANKGLVLLLDERRDIQWQIDSKTGNAARSKGRTSEKEIQMCARCHSRRSPISNNDMHGEPLLDHYLPRLLDEGMYFADGQINDEVYVYGSFIQSKMFHAGVTCSDCHEPHSMALRAPGNGVCLQCHQATKYDQAKHHFHKEGATGASCAECHMPPKTYMVVDPRHDHSMRIPRPDLSVKLGTPNACNNCHTDKDAKWADKHVKTWYGSNPAKGFQTYATALQAAREHRPGADNALAALIRDTTVPNLARATALAELAQYLSPRTIDVVPLALSDHDPAVRAAATGALEQLPVDLRVRLAFPMLEDPVRVVRIEAARVLMAIPAGELSSDQRSSLDRAMQEYVAAQMANAERPEAQTSLGNLYAAQGKTEKAVAAYQTALELNPMYMPGYVNLADFYRAQGNEQQVEFILRQALKQVPKNAVAHHVLGLSLVRQQRLPDALQELQKAALLDPQNARYTYIYAVALHAAGKQEQAIGILKKANTRHPDDIDILNALVAYNRDRGNETEAGKYAEKLRAITH